jgi:hypothetical protein
MFGPLRAFLVILNLFPRINKIFHSFPPDCQVNSLFWRSYRHIRRDPNKQGFQNRTLLHIRHAVQRFRSWVRHVTQIDIADVTKISLAFNFFWSLIHIQA